MVGPAGLAGAFGALAPGAGAEAVGAGCAKAPGAGATSHKAKAPTSAASATAGRGTAGGRCPAMKAGAALGARAGAVWAVAPQLG